MVHAGIVMRALMCEQVWCDKVKTTFDYLADRLLVGLTSLHGEGLSPSIDEAWGSGRGEQVFLAVAEQTGYDNMTYGSWKSRAVVAFLRGSFSSSSAREGPIVLIDDELVSLLFVPSTSDCLWSSSLHSKITARERTLLG